MTVDSITNVKESLLDGSSIRLDADEQYIMASLAEALADTPPALVDDAEWLAQARASSCRLPTRIAQTIRHYRHDSGIDGMLEITNLPLDFSSLPPTPSCRDSVERDASKPAAIAIMIAQQLGEIVAYRDEKMGALVQNVVPVASLARSQSNGGSVPLKLHTENAFHPYRPDYVGLLCLRPAEESTVGTQIASVRNALPLLDEPHTSILHQARFVTTAPPSFRRAGDVEPHPVLGGAPDDPDIRVDFNATSGVDQDAKEALHRLHQALTETSSELVLSPGDMVFLDNRLVVHGRSAFTPRYDGNDRWLHRVFVHLDTRRSRLSRPANGPVLV
ncbi:TauD/TfdA family dioxygenase [Streptomyces sp. NPDC057137]|uniref:TauD/TfdA family dioxygenase n=1 Tax=Streptomyces sp. NPDC057137 TaxID=3346030 RepID=UPI003632B195